MSIYRGGQPAIEKYREAAVLCEVKGQSRIRRFIRTGAVSAAVPGRNGAFAGGGGQPAIEKYREAAVLAKWRGQSRARFAGWPLVLMISLVSAGGAGAGAAQGPEDLVSYEGGELPEVVIKGEESGKLVTAKPAFKMDVDNFESIRSSLEPAYDLLLSESPLSLSWSRNRPEILHNPRIIKPWRTAFSEHTEISFHPRNRLREIFRGEVNPKDLKKFQWQLLIADEEGRVFQKYSGSGEPPQELVWSGQNERDEWIKAGHAYSAVYLFTDASGSPHTGAGNPLEFTGIVHQEEFGLHISLDSVVLFGSTKSGRKIEKPFGENLIQATADLIKRKYFNIPIRVYSYAQEEHLAQQQAGLVVDFLTERLMILHSMISSEGRSSPFSEQRIDIVLMNR